MLKTYFLITPLAGFVSVHLWGRMPDRVHWRVSRVLSKISNWKISRFFIPIYCLYQYGHFTHYRKFKPGNGSLKFRCFQDFFTREFLEPPRLTSNTVWPCEGLLCDSVPIGHAKPVVIKGQPNHIRTVFGAAGKNIPNQYHFSNVFLHNNNYHHIHAPVSGTIARIEHIPGQLLLLRPWAYKNKPSLPALRNERINLDMIDDNTGERWYLSIIGGPLVATIKLVEKLKIGTHFSCGERLGGFLMGSTCCMAAPKSHQTHLNHQVQVGEAY